MRIDKLLGNLGFGTRTELKKIAKTGVITVNGEIIKNTSIHVDPNKDVITFKGNVVEYKEFVYLMLNKPPGFISSTYDPVEPTVLELIEEEDLVFEPFPVGRLDKDTEGLLILSNDGKLAHNILSPKKHIFKKYFAHIEGIVTKEDIDAFKSGVVLEDGYKCLSAKLEILESAEISKVYVTIQEGKYHQIKRMFEQLSKKVSYLQRIQMGQLKLDTNLKLGEYRDLTDDEILLLQER